MYLKNYMRLVAIVLDSTALEQMESFCKEAVLKKVVVAFRSLKCWGARGTRSWVRPEGAGFGVCRHS